MLILGSLPGEASLTARRYYAHPRNQFWKLVGGIIEADLEALDYCDRLAALLAARIGLWDSVARAKREGSLDTRLREVEPTPLTELTATLPKLRAIGFNGAKSAKIGMRDLASSNLELVALPSSSPAHAAMTLEEKQQDWNKLRKFLR